MLPALLGHLPASVLMVVAVALLIIASGLTATVFAVLLSEVACRRIIRLVNALAKLCNKDISKERHKRKEHLKN